MAVLPNMLAPHFMAMYDANQIIDIAKKFNSQVIKFAFTPPSTVIEVMSALPSHVEGIYRLWWDYGESWIGTPNNFGQLEEYAKSGTQTFNVNRAVDEWLSPNGTPRQNIQQIANRPEIAKRILVEGYNETGNHYNYWLFERERAKRLASMGLRACVGNSGVGWNLTFDAAKDAGLLDVLNMPAEDSNGNELGQHYWGTHGYGCGLINMFHGEMQANTQNRLDKPFKYYADNFKVLPAGTGNSWLAFRVDEYDSQLRALGYHNIKHVITEFGYDASANQIIQNYYNQPISHYKSTIPFWQSAGLLEGTTWEAFFKKQMLGAEKQLREYKRFLKGATIFTVGSDATSAWRGFDIYNP